MKKLFTHVLTALMLLSGGKLAAQTWVSASTPPGTTTTYTGTLTGANNATGNGRDIGWDANGIVYNLNNSNFSNFSCTYWGFPKTGFAGVDGAAAGAPTNGGCTNPANLNTFSASSNLAGGVAIFTGSCNYRVYNNSNMLTTVSVSTRITITVTNASGGSLPWTDAGGYIYRAFDQNLRVRVLIEAAAPSGVPYIVAKTAGTFYPCIQLYDALRTDGNSNICTGFSGGYYTTGPAVAPQAVANITVGPAFGGSALLPDANLTASSCWSGCVGGGHESWRGRLFNQAGGTQAWATQNNVVGEYLQIDLGSIKPVNGVVTQIRGDCCPDQRFVTYQVQISPDGSTWHTIPGTFNGNPTASDFTAVTNWFGQYHARYVRFYPQTWGTHMSARVDVLSIPESAGAQTVYLTGDMPTNANTIRWYTAATGGTAFATAQQTSVSISANTTYYAEAYNSSTGCFSPTRTAVIARVNKIYGAGPAGVGATDGTSLLNLWLDASKINQATGTAVATWADASGKGNNATQATAGRQPVLQANMNGSRTIRFDGVDDFIATASYYNAAGSFYGSNLTPFTVLSASKYNGINGRIISGTPQNWLLGHHGGQEDRAYFEGWLTGGCTTGGVTATNTGKVYTGDGNRRWIRFFANGTLNSSASCGSMYSPGGMGLGAYVPGPSEYSNADIGDVITYELVLNDARRRIVENYLSAKYGIALGTGDVYTGDNVANGDCDFDMGGIGRELNGYHLETRAGGLHLATTLADYLKDVGDYIFIGRNSSTTSWESSNIVTCGTPDLSRRLSRIWYMQKVDVGTTGGNVTLTYSFTDLNLGTPVAGTYHLLYRSGNTGNFASIATGTIAGNTVTYTLNASSLGNGQYTLGYEADQPRSIALNGTQYVEVPNNTTLSTSGNFTYEMWVRPTSYTSNNTYFENGAWADPGTLFRQDVPGTINLYINGTVLGSIAYAPPLNLWTHLALVRSGSVITLYANGASVGNFTSFGNAISPANVMRIGSSVHNASQKFIGQMDEFRLWNRALTAAEITTRMHLNIANTDIYWGNLQAYYKFNEAAGSVVYDLSQNSNNGTRVASPAVTSLSPANPVISAVTPTPACATAATKYKITNGNANSRLVYNWAVSTGTITAGQGTDSIMVLWGTTGAKTVNCTVTHSDECYTEVAPTFNVTINPPALPTVASTTIVGCGQASIYADTGLHGTTVRFYGPNSTTAFLGSGTTYSAITGGTYYVTSYNANTLCESAQVPVSVTVSPTFDLTVTNSNFNTYGVSCANSTNGTVTATVTSTANPITYAWSNGLTNIVSSPANTISALGPGNYSVVVTDNNGCVNTGTATLTAPPILTASLTLSSFNGFGLNCNGGATGSITTTPAGGVSPYGYSWTSTPGGFTSGSGNISGLTARTYNLTITDANGCPLTTSEEMTQPAPVTFTTSVGYVCSGSSYTSAIVTVNAAGGASAAYQYSMDGGAWQAGNTFSGLANSTTHSFQVRDATYNTCTSAGSNVTITFPPNGTSVGDCNYIYVSAGGDPSGTLGSKACPVTLPQALVIFAGNTARNHILMLAGSYTYNQKITIPANVTIDGGYTQLGSDWVKATNTATSITLNPVLETQTVGGVTVGHYIGLQAGGNNFILKDLTISVWPGGVSGVTSSRGRSVYGLYVNGQTGFSISRCIISTGAGSDGNAGAGIGGSGGAGGGGNFGKGDSTTAAGCSKCGNVGLAGGSGNGGAAGGGGGGRCCSSGCNLVGCNSDGCNAGNGGNGLAGAAGAGFTAGNRPASSGGVNTYYVPVSGSQGSNGGGGGGGGGGGSGASGTCCTCNCGTIWARGGRGGNGGGGGLGGNLGFGGGASIAVYANSGSGSLVDCQLNPGSGGTGGNGGAGQSGVNGDNGIAGGDNTPWCDGGRGGSGGTGGRGGDGGRGQDGANGLSQAIVNTNGATVSQSGTTVPATGVVTANVFRGCTNSEIILTKTSGSWNISYTATPYPSVANNPTFTNNLTNSSTSYSNTSNTISLYFTTPGVKDIQIGSTILENFIHIYNTRTLPTIVSSVTTTAPCANDPITVSTSFAADQWEWQIANVASPLVQVFSTASQSPGTVNPPSGGWVPGATYQIRLRVFDNCNGWSIPVYLNFTVRTVPAATSAITRVPPVACANSTGAKYYITAVAGVSYTWQVTGGSITAGQNTDTITVNWGGIGAASVQVTPSNTCGNGTPTVSNFNINANPVVTINPLGATAFCHPGTVNLQANSTSGGGAGTGSFNYAWSPGGSTAQVLPASPATEGTFVYTVTATESGSQCSASASQNVTANPIPVATVSISNQTICSGGTTTAINLGTSNSVPGTTFAWSRNGGGTVTGIGTTGSGNIPATALVNTTSSTVTVTFTFTPTGPTPTNCVGGQVTSSVVINATVGTPAPITVAAGVEPTCAVPSGTTTTYATTAANGTGFNWSTNNPAAGSIDPTSGLMSWTTGFTGTVNIEVTANGCNGPSSQTIRTVTVNSPPAVPAATDVTACLSALPVTLTATPPGGSTVDWYNAASAGTLLQSGSTTYSANAQGTYYAESRNTATGCVSATRKDVNLIADQPVTNLTASSVASSVCVGDSLRLTASATGSGINYSWTGPGGFTSNAQNPVHFIVSEVAGQGDYIVTASNTCAGASDTTTVNIHRQIPALSTPTFLPGNPVCEGSDLTITVTYDTTAVTPSDVTWAWTGPDNFVSALQNPTINSVTPAAQGDYVLVATNACATQQTAFSPTLLVQPAPGIADAGPPQNICNSTVATLAATAPAVGTGSWSIVSGSGGNFSDTLSNTSDFTGVQGTTYILRWSVTNGSCAANTDDVNITFANTPTVTATNAGPYVTGQTIQLNALPNGYANYSWSHPGGFVSGAQNPAITGAGLADAGTYTVTVTDGNGCTASASTSVTVNVGTIVWVGNSIDWHDPANWTPTVVPNSCSSKVLIPFNPSGGNPPTVFSVVSVGDIEVQNGIRITLDANMNVCGAWKGAVSVPSVIIGTQTVVFIGTAVQPLEGRTQFTKLHLSNAAGIQMQAASRIDIIERLELENGDLNTTGGILRFLSTSATQVGIIDDFSAGYTGTLTGNITAQRYYDAPLTANSFGQRFMGSPVNSPPVTQFGASGSPGFLQSDPNCYVDKQAPSSPWGNFFEYDEGNGANCGMESWKVVTSGTAQNGKGYSVAKNGAGVINLTGVANLNASYTVTGLGNSNWSNVGTYLLTPPFNPVTISSGWHLVSNPYLAYMDLQTHVADSAFGSQVQVWETTGPFAGSYQPRMAGTGDALIAPFQAFMVHKLSTASPAASFTIFASDRTLRDTTFFRRANDHELRIFAEDISNGKLDVTTVAFNAAASKLFDPEYDAEKLMGSGGRQTLYTLGSNKARLAINTNYSTDETPSIPMSIQPGATGTYKLRVEGVNSFEPTSYIYLEDKATGQWTDLRQNPAYTFTMSPGENIDRFVLHFTPPVQFATVDADCNAPGEINIAQSGSATWHYKIVDAVTQILMASGALNQNIPVHASVEPGLYTLTLTDNANYTVVKNIQVGGAQSVIGGFTTSTQAPQVMQDITFHSDATNAAQYEWEFSDGTIITGVANPVYAFIEPGTYTVTLTVVNDDGCVSATTQTITVSAQTGIGLTDIISKGAIRIWGNKNKVLVDFSRMKHIEATIEIYNVLGQQISSEKYNTPTIYSKELNQFETAYVIVKVKNENSLITKKVLITNK